MESFPPFFLTSDDFPCKSPALPSGPSFCHSWMFLSWEEGALTLLQNKKKYICGRKVAEFKMSLVLMNPPGLGLVSRLTPQQFGVWSMVTWTRRGTCMILRALHIWTWKGPDQVQVNKVLFPGDKNCDWNIQEMWSNHSLPQARASQAILNNLYSFLVYYIPAESLPVKN